MQELIKKLDEVMIEQKSQAVDNKANSISESQGIIHKGGFEDKTQIQNITFKIYKYVEKLTFNLTLIFYFASRIRKNSSRIAIYFGSLSELSDDEEGEKKTGKFQWAIELDAEKDVPDFYTQIVNLAYQFPFELDPFQKQV